MTTTGNEHGAAERAAVAAAVRGAARRRRLAVLAPVAVGAMIATLIGVSVGDAVVPAREVRVSAAVFAQAEGGYEMASVDAAEGQAERGPVRGGGKTVQAPGWLEAEPYFVACTALADGVVEEMLVLEGQSVEKGQVVARLVDDDARLALGGAEAELRLEQAGLASAEAELAAAQTEWDEPVERERAVAATRAALAGVEAELAQLPAMVRREQAVLERLKEELKRAERAEKSGAANEIEVIVLRKDTQAQAAEVEVMEQREGVLEARRDELRAEVRAAERDAELRVAERRRLDDARAKVARGKAAVAGARVRVDEAALRLERMTIRSPIGGLVQRRLKSPGDKVMLGMDSPHSAHLVHVYDPEKMQVRVDVPLADAQHVYVGQGCEVVVDVLPDETFVGEVTRITHEADLQKNTLQVKVKVFEPSVLLKPEMLTRVKFLPRSVGEERDGSGKGVSEAQREPVVLVAQAGMADGGDAVWVVRNRRGTEGVVRRVAVRVEGSSDEAGWVRVRGEVNGGDLVVLDGEGLSDGQRVRMVSGHGGKAGA